MTLRVRLALFIAFAIAAALLTQGVLGYWSFRQRAYDSLDRDLTLYLSQAQVAFQRERGPDNDLNDGPNNDLDGRSNNVQRESPLSNFQGLPNRRLGGPPPSVRRLFDTLLEGYVTKARVVRGGEVIAAQEGFPANIPAELGEAQTYGIWRVGSVAVGPPQPSASSRVFIQGAISSNELMRGLERYRRTLLVTTLGVSLLGALAALLLSRPALRPLDHLLDTAQRVATSGDLSLRVPPGGSGELGRLSETFNRMLARLSAFRQRESSFTRSASHELRTPLASMKLHLSSYREGYADADETLEVLEEEVERMTRLSEALLVLAREGRTQQVGVDLAALAQEVARREEVSYRGLEHVERSGDPILLRQALLNLVENAKKHAPDSEIIVKLETSTDQKQPCAVLSVSDTGPGMSQEARQRATEAFYRAPGTRTSGSGLGLTVVAQVAQVHGGRLELTASQPTGLSAALWLPLQEDVSNSGVAL